MVDLLDQMDLTVSNFVENFFYVQQWKKFTVYLRNNWFNPNNTHFLGFNSNFHKELITTVTPQVTYNPAESLNRVLKSQYDSGRIGKKACAHGIHQFFHGRRIKLAVFLNNDKVNNRKPKDLKKWENQQFIAQFLNSVFQMQNLEYNYKVQCLYEAAYKYGRIQEENINDTYRLLHSNIPSHFNFNSIFKNYIFLYRSYCKNTTSSFILNKIHSVNSVK